MEKATLEEQVEHYKLYLKAWQRARSMVVKELTNKDRPKEEKEALRDIFNYMTESMREEVKKVI